MGTRGTPVSKSTSKSEAEFPNGKQPVLWASGNSDSHGRQFVVPNPKPCDNFNHMVKHERSYLICGKKWRIHGVCPYAFHVPPYPVGIPILLECLPL